AYYHRGIFSSKLVDKQGAIDDYTQAIRINPNCANAYFNRGLVRSKLGDKQGEIKDIQIAANIYKKEGKETDYQKAMEKIKNMSK
ncbi:tetratricopeptide repeat protein, partial [Dolichospermum sp. ST_con]|nr:tetratricopeptide repeat protein [Dolichospermum sp. ST_con]